MGSSSSTPVQPVPAPGHAPIVLTPFKEIPEFQGPDKNKIYQVLEGARSGAEGGGEGGRMSPVKFKYFTAQGEWGWKWTLFSDERIYYVVKEESYQYYSNIETETENENENENGDDRKSSGTESSGMMTTYKLQGKSEKIRKYLAENDPLPPRLLREMGMSNNAYFFVAGSNLAHTPNPKCKFVMKEIVGILMKHPALIFYKDPPRYNNDHVMILHLVKSSRHGKVEIRCNSQPWANFQAGNTGKWTVGEEEFQLNICLLDIAKWCVKFEQQNPNYSKPTNNCRKFMLELAKFLNIHWNDANIIETAWYQMNDKSGICTTEQNQCRIKK